MLQKLFPKPVGNVSDARPTPLEIADGVRRQARHQLLERELAALRERHEATRRSMMQAREGKPGASEARERTVIALGRDLESIERDIRDTRRELAPLRLAHGERVEQALRPLRREAGRKVAAALADLEAAVVELDIIHDGLRRHAYDAPPVRMPDVDAIRGALRRIS